MRKNLNTCLQLEFAYTNAFQPMGVIVWYLKILDIWFYRIHS